MSQIATESYTGGCDSSRERVTYNYDARGSAVHEIDTSANGTYGTLTKTKYLLDHQNFPAISK